MFEPSEEDDVWRNQQGWSLISWKLYETCGVHTLLMDGTLVCINMLVEKKYPLTQEMLTRMLNWRLEADFENEMAYELIRGGLLGIKAFQVSTAGYKSFYCWLKKLLLVKIRENSLRINSFEHTKKVFLEEVIPFMNSLRASFKDFDNGLHNELNEVKMVFNQMEAVVEQCSVDKKYFDIQKKELLLENDGFLD
ncbi:hypothetical protein Tco_0109920 [Tanacetum coccineum]